MTATSHGNGATSLLERPELERTAADHLWFHGWDMDWEELTEREGLKVFARAKDSTLYDVRGREYLDGLSGLMVVNVGHGRREIGEAMADAGRRDRVCRQLELHDDPDSPARGNAGPNHARRPQPRLFLFRWIGSGRDRPQDRQTGASAPWVSQTLQDHRSAWLLSRDDPRCDESHRRSSGGVLRALHVRRFPRAITQPLPERFRARRRRRATSCAPATWSRRS